MFCPLINLWFRFNWFRSIEYFFVCILSYLLFIDLFDSCGYLQEIKKKREAKGILSWLKHLLFWVWISLLFYFWICFIFFKSHVINLVNIQAWKHYLVWICVVLFILPIISLVLDYNLKYIIWLKAYIYIYICYESIFFI